MDLGPHLADDLARALLVCRIAEREEVTNRDRGNALCAQRFHRGAQRLLIERHHHRTVRGNPLGNGEAAAARRKEYGGLRLEEEIVEMRALVAADLEDIFEAIRGDEAGDGAFLLDKRVDRDRTAVDEPTDISGFEIDRSERTRDAIAHAVDQIAGRRGDLGVVRDPIVAHQDDVGKRAADIDADFNHDAMLSD